MPAGGPEQRIQGRILKGLKKHGIWATKVITANRNGVPDILACHEGCFVAIEVKTPKGRVSKVQEFQIEQIRRAGGIALVATCWKDVAEVLQLEIDM